MDLKNIIQNLLTRKLSLASLLIIILGLFLFGALVFGVHSFVNIKKENERLRSEISETINVNELLQMGSSTTTENSKEKEEDQGGVFAIFKKPIIDTPKSDQQISIAPAEAKVEYQTLKEEVSVVQTPKNSFNVVAIRQTAYPDQYGGVYGSYEMEIGITSNDSDLLVPPTTTNTVGTGAIGFSYSVEGDSFRGTQDSKVTCSLRSDGFCKIKSDGRERYIIVTIFLYPDQYSDGNYSVKFDKIYYYMNGVKKEFSIGRQTAPINLQY